MGFKIRDDSTNVKRRKNKEKKIYEKQNGCYVNTLQQQGLNNKQPETIVESLESELKFQASQQLADKGKEKKNKQNLVDTNIYVKNHTLIGSISYGDKHKNAKELQQNSQSANSINLSSKPIEQQVLEYYQDKIDKLDVRQTLKSYLRRTLDTIILSNENDKIFLLEIRKQLKQSQRIAKKQEYSDFLKLVDNLYLLAVDKCITSIFQGTANPRSPQNQSNALDTQESNPPQQSNTNEQSGEQNPNSGSLIDNILRLHNNNSSDIIRILQRNALQRLAQAYRRVTSNNFYNSSRQISSSSANNANELQNSNRQSSNQNFINRVINQESSSSSIESNSRRTYIGSWSNYEDNFLGSSSSQFVHNLRPPFDNDSEATNTSSNTPNYNINNFSSVMYNNLVGQEQEDEDDIIIPPNDSQNENSLRRLIPSQSNSNLLMLNGGRNFGFRSISNQVAANQGDTSIQTSSETGSNFSS